MITKKFQFCDLDESLLPPPVPPRRKRCKTTPKRSILSNMHATKPERKHRPAPPLPPPTAPQRSRTARKTPSPYSEEDSSLTSSFVNKNEYFRIDKYDEIDVSKEPQKILPVIESETLESEELYLSQLKPSFCKSPESNQYPPLYFTFQDYQTVMEESLTHKIKENERTLQKEPKNQEISKQKESFEEILETQRDGVIEKVSSDLNKDISQTTFSPFMETVTFSNAREEIYFRVTTTDRPFEKCLGDWNESYDYDVTEFNEETNNDSYVFEDYLDRSNKLNTRPGLLFSEDFFSIPQDDNSASTERSTTRVRFVIESPSTSTPDLDLEGDCTSYEEFVEKQFENYEKSSVQLVELTDEESLNLDKTVKNTIEIESKINVDEIGNSNAESIPLRTYTLTAKKTSDSYSEWEEDIDIFSMNACITNEARINSLHDKKIQTTDLEKTTSENIFSENGNIEMNLCQQEKNCDDKLEEKLDLVEKIFNDSSQSYLSNKDIGKWKNHSEDEKDDTFDDADSDIDKYIKGNPEATMNRIFDIPVIIEPSKTCDDTFEDEREKEIVILKQDSETRKVDKNIIISDSEAFSEKVAEIKKIPREEKLVPTNMTRNSFLETMLTSTNSSQDVGCTTSVNCAVVATHPKQDSNILLRQKESSKPLGIIVATKPEVASSSSSKIKLMEFGSRPKVQGRINGSPSYNASVSEVKSDMLNELLTNFSAIKLKPINTSIRESFRLSDFKDEKVGEEKDLTKFTEVKTDETRGIKYTNESVENIIDEDSDINLNSHLRSVGEKNINITPVDKDMCAIVKEAPYFERKDNDNKVMTPVVVSKDQFREAITITPGSVRSFVKYYEIHSEISSISKISDNAFKKQKNELARENEKKKANKFLHSGERNKKASKNSAIFKTGISKKPEERVIVESDEISHSQMLSNNLQSHPQKQSCLKSSIPSPKPDRKKSVQFHSGCTVINANKKEEKGEEEGTFSSFIGGIRTRLKKKAPAKPEAKKYEQPKESKLEQRFTESTAIICIQVNFTSLL